MDLSTADALVGQRLDGRYRVDGRVARGGMATVYTGFDTRLDRTVAIKVMHQALAEDDAFVERFRREAKAAARLSHPNVVAIYDQGEDAGRVYLVMEQVAGETLRALLRTGGALEPDRALAVAEGLLAALAAAHDAGIVHRDVKPENVLLTADGQVKVADFGLARAIEATSHTVADGTLIGTVAYLAPEQVATGAADPRTDLYSAGVVLFEMLTGEAPFTGDTPITVAYRHVNEDVPAPSSVRPGLPRALDQLVGTATRRPAGERYADARAMLAAVRRVRADLGSTDTAVIPLADIPTTITRLPGAPPPPPPPSPPPPSPVPPPAASAARRRLRRGPVTLVALALVLAAAAVSGWYVGSGRYVDASRMVGLTLDQARAAAARDGLSVRTGDPVFSETVPAGQVATQDPGPGDRVRRGGTVTVRLSKGRDLVALPDVRGKTADQARTLLEDNRLRVGRVIEEFHATVATGLVIRAGAEPGTPLRAATAVDLYVSKGREPVAMPDVVGKQIGDAAAILKAAGLTYQRKLEYSDDEPEGEVLRQSPAKGTTVHRGDRVELVVSRGPEPVTVPDVVGKTRGDAKEKIEDAGLTVRFVDFPGRRGRRVYDQDPAGGTEVRKGSTVTLYMV